MSRAEALKFRPSKSREISESRLDTGEVILRSGTARVIGNEYGEGISDLTSGREIKNGELIEKDHHLLIPRGDGRGFITETVCYIIYKGLYYMQ